MAENIPNRQRYNELRRTYRVELLRSVDPTEALLSDLSSIESFKNKMSDIRSTKASADVADKILSLPSDKHYQHTIGPFMSVLRRNRHSHVASVFSEESNEELLTDGNYKRLQEKLKDLCTYLDPDCGIIESLISADVFDDSDEDRVRAGGTSDGKVREIIRILSRRSNGSYRSFISILQEMDQEHVLHILNENGSPPISKVHAKIINKEREIIVKHLDSVNTSFVDTLVSLDAFMDIDRQRVVKMGKVKMERNQQIVDILLRKSQRRFQMFLVALKRTSQEHLIIRFQGITINARLHINLSDDSRTDLETIETILREQVRNDLENEESELNNDLEQLGTHASGVDNGSIRIWFMFSTRETLEMARGDKLDKLFEKRYCKMSDKGLQSLQSIHVEIPEEEFKRCELVCMKSKALMKPVHQNALQFARDRIAKDIHVDEDLLDELSLCECRRDVILNQINGEDKARVLFDVMACRPDCEFQKFVNALRNTSQDNAANFIVSKFAYGMRCVSP